MKDQACPYLDDCFVVGSLREINVPDLLNYCSTKHKSCRYYRSRSVKEGGRLQEAGV